jgi:hypothetical protein
MSGNLGGGREGVQRAEYQSDADANRALYNQNYYNKDLIKLT